MHETLTMLVLAAFFVASVVNQLSIQHWAAWVARLDPWTLLPFWAFFAPNPAFADIHLVFRDRGISSTAWTEWAEIQLRGSNGWRWLWNPSRYEHKALHDMVNGMAMTAEAAKASNALNAMELSSCHLGLVAWMMAGPRIHKSQSRQFAVVLVVGHGRERTVHPVFVSREYTLD